MKTQPKHTFSSVEEYISVFSLPLQEMLQQLRKAIRQSAPDAEELISYNMPAFKLKGMLVYYAGYEKHIGFYPMPSGIEGFKEQLKSYKTSKGAIQFPLDQPLPLDLVKEIVKCRVEENLYKAKEKGKKKD